MGNDLAVREAQQVNVMTGEQLQYIAHTEFVPVGMRGKKEAILACVLTGRALGIDDMTALRSIHIIDGKATFSAELMVQLVRRRGHSIVGNFSATSCTVTGKRADNGDEMTVTWTKEMAQEAGLLGKNNWKKYGASMLWARAVSQLARMLFADCFAGATYTEDEIGDAEYEEVAAPAQESASAMDRAIGAGDVPAGNASGEGNDPGTGADQPAPSAAQLKKLNVLVGTLREAGKVTTEQVYTTMGRVTFTDGEPDFTDYIGEDGELHWSPLRDALTKAEASHLIEWLTAIEAGSPAFPPPGLTVAQLVANADGIDPLTVEQLKERAAEAGISLASLGAIAKESFPGRGIASDLSDVERGQLFADALADVQGAVANG